MTDSESCARCRIYRHGGECEFLRGRNCVNDFYVLSKDYGDAQWREMETYSKINCNWQVLSSWTWTDRRERKLINRCHECFESFRPPKRLIVETRFGVIDCQIVGYGFRDSSISLFCRWTSIAERKHAELLALDLVLESRDYYSEHGKKEQADTCLVHQVPLPPVQKHRLQL